MRRTATTMQCSACRVYFEDIKSFDAHRSGHVNNRKCAKPADLRMVRVRNTEVWVLPVS